MLDRFLYGLMLEVFALCDKEKSAYTQPPPSPHTQRRTILVSKSHCELTVSLLHACMHKVKLCSEIIPHLRAQWPHPSWLSGKARKFGVIKKWRNHFFPLHVCVLPSTRDYWWVCLLPSSALSLYSGDAKWEKHQLWGFLTIHLAIPSLYTLSPESYYCQNGKLQITSSGWGGKPLKGTISFQENKS